MAYTNQNTKANYESVRYDIRRQEMVDYLGGICVECGTPYELEIHHKDPSQKKYNISRIWSYAWEFVLTELVKCELRCHSCHIKKHFPDEHGTLRMYRRGCTCADCRKANSAHARKYK